MRNKWIKAFSVVCFLSMSLGATEIAAQDHEKFRQKLEKNLAKKTTPLFDATVKALCVCHDSLKEGWVGGLQYRFETDGGRSYYRVYCMVFYSLDSSPPWTSYGSESCNDWSPLPDR